MKIKINNIEIFQPDVKMVDDFVKKYTDDSTVTQDGVSHNSVLYVKKKLKYVATNIPADKAGEILRMIVKDNFNLTYFSIYSGGWVTEEFEASNIKSNIASLKDGEEYLSTLSFELTGVNAL